MPEITESVTVHSVHRVRISPPMSMPVKYGVCVTVKGDTMSAEFTVPIELAGDYQIGRELRLVAVVPE